MKTKPFDLFVLLIFALISIIIPCKSYAQFNLPDSDQDGIADLYELYGYSAGGSFIDFPALGANPYRKDVFIEADVVNGVAVPPNALQNVINAFASAPVINPNGSVGINMFIDASGQLPFYQEIDFDDQFTSEGHAFNPEIDVNGAGRIAICWQDDRDRNGYYQIYGRVFNANGNPAINETTINQESDGQQLFPSIGQNENGNFVVVWQDDRDGNGYYEIFGRVFNSTGNPVTNDIKINSVSDKQQLLPVAGMDDSGNWTAAWQDDRDGNGYFEIYCRKFNLNGNPLTGEIKVNPVNDGQQRNIKIATEGGGRSVIVWEDDRDGNGYYEIFARRMNANGNPEGNEIHVNTVSDGQQLYPVVAINDNGRFVVCWQDDRDGNGYNEIYARRFNSNGTANGGELHINQNSSGQQTKPDVALNSNDVFTVSWEDDRDKNGFYQIYARTFNWSGSARTNDCLVNTVSVDQQLNPAVGMSDAGNYTVVYQDDRDENNLWSLYLRMQNLNGSSVTGDIAVNDHPVKFNSLKERYFTSIRRTHFHYCIIAVSRAGTGSSGIADILGQDFIVSLGLNPGTTRFSGTFMHEFGHNINLLHGGNENKNHKPNYLSVMNYRYQFWGADNNCDASSSGASPGLLDYSQGHVFSLKENNLNESIGICNGERGVNRISNGQQIDPEIDASDDGRFVVVFEDDRDGNGFYEIFARPYDAAGIALLSEVHVNTVSSGVQRNPAVGMANNGAFVVAWEDDRDKNGYYEIFAQRFNASGSRSGSEFKINEEWRGNQKNPDIAAASDGTFIVVWEDDRNDNGFYEIYGRLFSSAGMALTSDIHINTNSDKQQIRPRVDIADDHRFVAVWEDDRDGNGYYEIYARRFNSNGTGNGGEIKVNSVSEGQQRMPDIGVSSTGQFVIVWEDDHDGNGYYEIYGRRFSANGAATGNYFKINQVSDGQQRYPRVASNDNFEFAVSWQDDRDNNGYYQIYARPFLSNGSQRANETTINPVSDGQQYIPVIAMDANAGIYITWQDDRDENSYYEIFAARGNSNCTLRDRIAIDWDGDGNSNENGVSADINSDDNKNTLKDHNDWKNIILDF